MTTDDRKNEHSPDDTGQGRRPYLKPAFKHEQVFETMALACGKIDDTMPGCGVVFSAS
jgi:hypothetical protein